MMVSKKREYLYIDKKSDLMFLYSHQVVDGKVEACFEYECGRKLSFSREYGKEEKKTWYFTLFQSLFNGYNFEILEL